MKIIFIVIAICITHLSIGQVGVGTTTPRGSLEVAAYVNGGGFLAPSYSLSGNNDTNTVRNPQGGNLISGTLVYNTNTTGGGNGLDEGLVYWDGNIWVGIVNTASTNTSAAGWELEGNVINGSHFLGSTNPEALRFRVNNSPVGELHPQGGVAFGLGATANVSNGISIGRDATAQQDGTVLGRGASGGNQTVAIGLDADASQQDAIAIGRRADSGGNRGIALGVLAETSNQNSTAIGAEAKALNTNAVAVGTRAVANGQNSFAFGFGSTTASGATSSIAIGSGSRANVSSSIAIGENAQGNGQRSIAIGVSTVASVNDATIVGSGADVTGINGTAIGRQAEATERGTAVGNIAFARGQRSVAIGNDSQALASGSIAIGTSTLTNHSNSIALGNGAITTSANQLALNNMSVIGISTLTASGQIRASNFQGNTANYPDYVFEKYYDGYSKIDGNYEFVTIEEASAFAKANGHLIGVKSYDEIKSNDFKFDIGNTSIKNLEKIEEHFLYLTEINETVKEQKAIIDAQNSEITSLKDRLKRLEELILKD